MKLITILFAALLLAGPAQADICADGVLESPGNGGKAWLGTNASGFVAGEGQSFVPSCGGQLDRIAFQLILDGQAWNGAPPLAAQSVLVCTVSIPGLLTLGTVTTTAGFDLGMEWVEFDFSALGVELTADTEYRIACAPAGAGQARLAYWQNEDVYADGVRYVSEGGINGPWIVLGPGSGDLAFRVTTATTTPSEDRTWSELKQLFR